jgi:diguanylate cyclase (GGDEF)-like protein
MEKPPSDAVDRRDVAESPLDGPTWNPEILAELQRVIQRGGASSDDLERELRRLEADRGESIYADCLYMLSHLRFEGPDAKQHWRRILAHRNEMQERLGSDVDLLVALVSYFVEVERKLETPKVIELRLFEQTQASAYRDELTNLCNFRLFREHLSRELQQAERYGSPLSLVMVDIDDFKHYNDTNGHEAGNEVLATMAGLIAASLRGSDVPARYGGEEFVLVLPATSKSDARMVAERARVAIEQHPFPHRETQPGGALTVSMGVATCPADGRDERSLVRHADQAMYVAKARGKNQVYLYGEDRRSFNRIQACLDGSFCVLKTDYHSLTTVNISEQGLLFVVDQELSLGALIDVRLVLPGVDHEMVATGRVVRVEERDDDRYRAAIRIVEIGTRDRLLLAGYIEGTRSAEEE